MKIFWGIVTVILTVAGVIGLYNEIEKMITGSAGAETVLRVGIALLCLVLAPKAYARAKSA
jgi:divalent metal cation (Fe/Co/Zn/Cd) transporter